jgi:hypothetical protein
MDITLTAFCNSHLTQPNAPAEIISAAQTSRAMDAVLNFFLRVKGRIITLAPNRSPPSGFSASGA